MHLIRIVLDRAEPSGYTGGMTNGHQRLRDFLRRSELNTSQLARLAQLTPMQLYHLLSERRRASLDVAVRLEDATRGAVPIRSWVEAS